ncbi:N-formylglutamate amidohydrolase [Paenalcaligenes sp. Me52]|uniref:N-formylglutamate amidohydrolase n=1 Tax=Paenalcaligenes sp. Me52 TaxID=3392038 RepID=UPI003D2C8418
MQDVHNQLLPFEWHAPDGTLQVPLVADSPHSGNVYPLDFRSRAPMQILRRAEDAFVDQLWSALPTQGAGLLAARVARSYVDLNRHETDLDASMMDAPWPGLLEPSDKTQLGHGLLWKNLGSVELYDRQLSVAEVQSRLALVYRPYHDWLGLQVRHLHRRFGGVWHLNLHSMPSSVKTVFTTGPVADFVLGDRQGTSCSADFIATVEHLLKSAGYRVVRNHPYSGAAIVAQVGKPAQNRHSLQIEVNRALYMDERHHRKSLGFAALQADLARVSQQLANYVHSCTS